MRANSDTQFLRTLPVEVVVADLRDLRRHPSALEDAGTFYHCAAFVRDWGTWQEFHDGTVDVTQSVVNACRMAGAGRFVHVSSISVYGNPPGSTGTITEDTPTGKYLWPGDYYGRSKILAEEVVRDYPDHVIIRPSWIYGRRDLVSLPRVIQAMRDRRARIIGSGDNRLNLVNAVDVARGIVLAAECPAARGQAYHLCSRGEITQREFFDLISDRLNLPRVKSQGAVSACLARRQYFRDGVSRNWPPNAAALHTACTPDAQSPNRFSIDKADRELGWRPEVPIREGLADALAWNQESQVAGAVAR